MDNQTGSAQADPDYFFIPLIFLESFNSPALVLKIGEDTIKMPLDWCMLIGEPDHGDLEVLSLTSINDRGFKAFTFNPLSDYKPEFRDVEIVDVYHQSNKGVFEQLGISFDYYDRTSAKHHHQTAQELFLELEKKGATYTPPKKNSLGVVVSYLDLTTIKNER